ncbi:IS3 family transposase [Thiohalobacter thiocyanaticus]|uniref:IS3 family transposase n=1 Tax=Thiohalobacter thiocyanaticus TaxID=585455 RepID=A0A426QLL5_9GAMM|nr:IS3 family transposase [Thiohalobacter thiocyanaticus]
MPGKKVDAFRFIEQHVKRSSVAALCRKLGVTRGGFYAWRNRGQCQRRVEDEALLEQIIQVHRKSQGRYGYPRVHQALRQNDILCGRNRVARLMRENGIAAKMARRFRRHRHRHHLFRDSTNLLLDREPTTGANQVWVGDITFISVDGKWSYLSTVMDRHTRQIIGWSFAKDRSAALVREALLMAVQAHAPTADTIFHSDQGCEYASKEYRRVLESFGLRVSMSRKGHCWDNAYMESFFHTLKTEMIYFQKFKTLEEATAYIIDYVRFYNSERLHSGLNYRTPDWAASEAA